MTSSPQHHHPSTPPPPPTPPPLHRLEAMLPPWAKLHRMNPALPLAQQVTNARVLIPTTGHVDAQVIAAAPHCKLIAQPAAGTANIDKEEAKRRGIPVTYAPGGLSNK